MATKNKTIDLKDDQIEIDGEIYDVLAYRVYFKTLGIKIALIISSIICACLLILFFINYDDFYFLPYPLISVGAPMILTLAIVLMCYNASNNKNYQMVFYKDGIFYFIDDKKSYEVPAYEIKQVYGNREIIYSKYAISTMNYGKLKIITDNKDYKKIVLKNVYEPEIAADKILNYLKKHKYKK